MSKPTQILSPRQPIADPNGFITHDWYRSLNGLFSKLSAGASSGSAAASANSANSATLAQIAAGGENGLPTWGDLVAAIQATAAYAQSLTTITLLSDLSGPGKVGEIYLNEADGNLYKWVVVEGKGYWVSYILTPEQASALSATQIAALNLATIAGQITTTQISNNAIQTPNLGAGCVEAGNLAAGSVTTAALAVGSSTNLCWNSCMEIGSDGWAAQSSQTITGWGTTYEVPVLDPTWRLPGFGSGYINVANPLTTSDVMLLAWSPNGTDATPVNGIPTTAGAIVEASAQLMPHRCGGRVLLEWLDATGTFISWAVGTRVVQAAPANGNALTSYGQSWLSATAPTNAKFVVAYVEGFNDGAADIAAILGADPYLFFTEFSVGPGVPNSTSPQPWSPGGVSSISGGMIKTRTLQADRLLANSITANEMGANSVVFGTVAAGAIKSAQIAAGEVYAVNLASDTLITLSAQIGNALILNAHIGNLQVDNLKIANNAVSTSASGSGTGGSASISITSRGGIVQIIGQMLYDGTNWATSTQMTLSRSGTVLRSYSPVFYIPGGTNPVPAEIVYLDAPGAGTFTYTLSIASYWRYGSPNVTLIGMAIDK
jgi:hypothetical protein